MEQQKMDKKSKVLIWILCILFILSIGLTYERTMVSRNYETIENKE